MQARTIRPRAQRSPPGDFCGSLHGPPFGEKFWGVLSRVAIDHSPSWFGGRGALYSTVLPASTFFTFSKIFSFKHSSKPCESGTAIFATLKHFRKYTGELIILLFTAQSETVRKRNRQFKILKVLKNFTSALLILQRCYTVRNRAKAKPPI